MTKTPFPAVGAAIKGTRESRGLSVAKLAKVTGVSRRHIAATESGANVTLLVAQKLMQGLHLTELALDETAKVTAHSDGISPSLLSAVAEDLEEAAARILQTCNVLRAYAEGKQLTADHDEVASRGWKLIRSVTAQVRSSDTPEKIAALEKLVGDQNKTHPPRRRGRSA